MDFSREWTRFSVEAEFHQYRSGRIVDAHNTLLAECKRLRPMEEFLMLAEDENKRQREQIAALTAENVRLRAICAESRDHLLLVLPGIESYASASPVMVSRAANARAMLRNLEARDALAREGKP